MEFETNLVEVRKIFITEIGFLTEFDRNLFEAMKLKLMFT
jgi:hypothetical protein